MDERRREAKQIVACTAVFWWLTYGYRLLTMAYSHDALLLDQSGDARWQISIGRFMQPVYLQIRGMLLAPMVIGLFALAFLALSCLLVCRLLQVRAFWARVVICGIMVVNPMLIEAQASFIPWVDIYALALLLSVGAVVLWAKGGKRAWLSPVCVALSVAFYPSYVQVSATLCVMLLILALLEGQTARAVFFRGVSAVGMLLAGLVLYAVLLQLVMRVTGIASSDSYNSAAAGVEKLALDTFPALLWEAWRVPMTAWLHPVALYPSVSVALHAGLFALTGWGMAVSMSGKDFASKGLLALLCVLCLPLAQNMVYLLDDGYLSLLLTYAFSLGDVLLVVVLERWLRKDTRVHYMLRYAAAGGFAVLLGMMAALSNQVMLMRDIGFATGISGMTRILDCIEQAPGYVPGETPVAIIGNLSGSRLSMARPGLETAADSFSENGYAVTYELTNSWFLQKVLAQPIRLVDERTRQSILVKEEVREMPRYPQEGYMTMMDGILVVCLSGGKAGGR